MRVPLTALVVGCVLGWPLVVQAGEGARGSNPSFEIGERLTFEVSWLSITAATAVLEVAGMEGRNDRTLAKLVGTAQSRPILTRFFPVDNRVESEVDLDTLAPEHMTFRRREGKKKEDIEYVFHQKDGTVTTVRGGLTELLPIPTGTQDIISCLYYTRARLPLKPGASLTMNVYHDKKNRPVEVRVEDVETIGSRWGDRETARLLVIMPFHGYL
ncbi:MAG: DUF3108 domain-containing protein [Nitrospira sp.]|nr:DUF3108 domain-containing protein [Nitrospira sp.]